MIKTLLESEDLPITVTCPTCGLKAQLWFNGGELDRWECHVTKWTLRHTSIALITETVFVPWDSPHECLYPACPLCGEAGLPEERAARRVNSPG